MSNSTAEFVAHTILQGADAMFGRFLDVTSGAQQRFETQDWQGVQNALKQRIHFYDHHVTLVTHQLKMMLGRRYAHRLFLAEVKRHYQQLLYDYPRYDIAESFFNSIYCRLFSHRHLQVDRLFIHPVRHTETPTYPIALTRQYQMPLGEALRKALGDTPFTLMWQNLDSDLTGILEQLKHQQKLLSTTLVTLEMVREPFFRNKAAYLVGKITVRNRLFPLVLPILNPDRTLKVDACITTPNEISILFGFARSYFMVYAPAPASLVAFLSTVLPNKTQAELYTAIGCQKHGKTELYRDFLHHLQGSTDKFTSAKGVKGMVMTVFTLPSYDFVFKIIKDKFAPQKNVSHQTVKNKYQLVKEHDRVGRMADTQEYRNFCLDKERIDAALLAELKAQVPSRLTITQDHIIIDHLYMERRMIPLNLYLQSADETATYHAIEEYGNAIKQLMSVNIFPGDMLFKNFGVTRHNRVIFYDYDEISYMTDMHFRHIPPPRYPEDELSAEPWYSIGENDVFPEEFRHFLFTTPKLKALFEQLHPELFDPKYWQQCQQRCQAGDYPTIYPYPERYRLNRGSREQITPLASA